MLESRFACAVVFGVLAAGLWSDPVIVLEPGAERPEMAGTLLLLEDSSGRMTLDDALAARAKFTLWKDKEPNVGFTSSAWWARLALDNRSGHTDWLLEHAYPPMESIQLFVVRDGKLVRSYVSGDSVRYDERPAQTRTFVFPIDPGTGITEYYLRCSTQSAMVFPLRVWHRESFAVQESQNQLLLGMFFGLMAVMVLYNLFIWASTRERSYLYYVLFVASHILFQACVLGAAVVYLWSRSPWWTDHSLVIFASLATAFSALFTREFLQTRRWVPRLHRVVNGCLIIALVNCVASLLMPYRVSIVVTNTTLIVFSVVYVVTALSTIRRGYHPARLYLVAWLALLIAVVVVALKNFGLVPSNALTSNALQIGAVVEVTLLSFAITDRINLLRREKLDAEQELREATEERLYTDALTGLGNRIRLLSSYPQISDPVLYLVNIDHFKQINDFYGNRIGDAVLLELARRIQEVSSPGPSTLFKLHADEFALVVEGRMGEEAILAHGRNLYAAAQMDPYEVSEQQIRLDVSIGISHDESALLEQADMALTQARISHDGVRIYDPSMRTMKQYEENLTWVGVIRDALRDDRITAYYQPILNNHTGEIEKYECLVRLTQQDGEVVSPGVFLPIAKASRLYPDLTKRVMQKSFATFADSDREFSINISIEDILQMDTMLLVMDLLQRYSVGDRVVFEILESEGIHRYDLASKFITEVKAAGCRIAIDDFGTGYSNFEHILRLRVDYLKIDASLVRNLHEDEHAHSIVETIQDFASKLGIRTVAEFVHCAEVLDRVQALGIDYSQGYLIGPPAPTIGEPGV